MKREDFGYSCNKFGYQIQYKEKNIGGAGTLHNPKMHWRHARANIKDFTKSALVEIDNILDGKGRVDMLKEIENLDKIL